MARASDEAAAKTPAEVARPGRTGSEVAQATKISENDGYKNRPFAIELQGAPFGGPLGIFGVALNYAPIQNLSFEAGVGVGGFGPQVGAAVRPKLIIGEDVALEFSVGYSFGDYKQIGMTGAGYLFRNCSWINADIGFEWRAPGHILLRPFFGFSKLVNSRAPVWHEGSVVPNTESHFGSRERYPVLPYLGLAIGYYFWI